MQTIERRAAQTILEESVGQIIIDGHTYEVPAPTTGTLVMVSALISELPDIDLTLPDDELPGEMLHKAKDCRAVADIVATLILGAKKIKAGRRRKWKIGKKPAEPTVDGLAEKILLNCTASQLRRLLTHLLAASGIDDFFIITTSLRTRNLLAATRTEVGKTTVSGPSSAAGQNISK
jgi:hypothetical protein